MKFSQFIRDHIELILEDWIGFARSLPSASRFNQEVLRDHAAGILTTIADDLESPQDAQHQEEKSKGMAPPSSKGSEARQHGSARLLDGFTVNDAVAEFRALRASVLRHWADACKITHSGDIIELTRFNEGIDQAITESLEGFSADKERSDRLVHALLAASPDLGFVVDLNGNLLYGNAAVASEFGRPLSAQQGQPFAQLDEEHAREFQRKVLQASKTSKPVRHELVRHTGNSQAVYEYILVAVPDARAETQIVAGSARDVTKRKVAEDRLRRGAHYDNLTGLPNRYLFRDRLEQEMKRAGRIQLPLALLYIDLDGFKQVNDQHGHECGDELLRQCADRLRGCVRGSDTVARLGGDEFTSIITEIAHLVHVDIIAQHILDELGRVFLVNGRELSVTGSIGIALYPRDASSSDELIRHADKALYTAKEEGRNNFRFFTKEMRRAAAVRMQVIGELRLALARRQLAVFYQPIVELGAGTIVGAEAQLRWDHPRCGLLPASEFFPLAAEAGLAVEIDEWVMENALANADSWNQHRDAPLFVSINHATLGATGKQTSLQRQAILDWVSKTTSPFALEIKESNLSRQTEAGRATFDQVAKAGVQIYLDDFGSGASSISSLTTGGLTGIKIDSGVVSGLEQAAPRAIVKGIVNLAHGLGLKVVAEGVETATQRDLLRDMGCDYAQGYLYYHAMPANSFAEMIRQ